MYIAAMQASSSIDSNLQKTMKFNKDLIAASSTPIVLAILSEGDSYGYAIIKRVQELSGGHMEWTDGMLYPVLHRLERLGYIKARWEEAESGRKRKYYRITPRGKTQLAEERKQWQAVDATLRGIWKSISLAVNTELTLAATLRLASLAQGQGRSGRGEKRCLCVYALSHAAATQVSLDLKPIGKEMSHEKNVRHHRWFCLRYDRLSFIVQSDHP